MCLSYEACVCYHDMRGFIATGTWRCVVGLIVCWRNVVPAFGSSSPRRIASTSCCTAALFLFNFFSLCFDYLLIPLTQVHKIPSALCSIFTSSTLPYIPLTQIQNSLHPLQYFHQLHSPLYSNCWHPVPVLIMFIMHDRSLHITMQSNHRHILASTPRRCCARSNVSPFGLPPVLFLLSPPASACIIHPFCL